MTEADAADRIVQVAMQIGLNSDTIRRVVCLSERHGHGLARVMTTGQSYVLKWFPPHEAPSVEVQAYTLLLDLGVPTLHVHAMTDSALLLEDLSTSRDWRLATEADVSSAAVGRAVARWYRVLHSRGAGLFAVGRQAPPFLMREIDRLDPGTILEAGRALAIEGYDAWRLAVEHVESLKQAMRSLPETLNYNDFYWTNLALSRSSRAGANAILFDYHLLGIGPRFSDCRNVTGSLAGEAVSAFWDEYGACHEREEILDRPLSTLCSLVTAAQMPSFPHWAQGSLDRVTSGDLARDLCAAMEVVEYG